jgi:exopolysaccharide production protein ExoQ
MVNFGCDGGAAGFLPRSAAPMPAASRARFAFELGLGICAFLFLPILVLASRGAAPLGAVAGICAFGLAVPNSVVAWRRVHGWAPLFAAVVLWGLASALWAVDPQHSLSIALRLTGLFVAGLSLMAAVPEIAAPCRVMAYLAAGLLVALVLTLVQFLTHGVLTGMLSRRAFIEPVLNQAEDGFGFLLLPLGAALFLTGRRLAAAALLVATAVVICLLVGEAARIAFLLGVAVAPLLYFWRQWLARVAAAMSVVVILAAPVIFPPLAGIDAARHAAQEVKSSMWHRLAIWSFVGSRIAEKPLFGWGLDSSRAIPGGNTAIPDGYPGQTSLPLHPHNAPLQVWLELGVPGALLFALFAARLWLALGRVSWPPLYAAAAGGSLVTALTAALGSYGIWQEWLIASEFLTLFLILVMARAAAQPMPETRSGSIS